MLAVRLRKQLRSRTIGRELRWRQSTQRHWPGLNLPNFYSFLEEWVMEWQQQQQRRLSFLHTVSELCVWKAHESEARFPQSVLFSLRLKLIFSTEVTTWFTRYVWKRGTEGQQLLLCSLVIIIINHPDAPNCQMRPFPKWSEPFVKGHEGYEWGAWWASAHI